jgi:hypothetical protein
MVAAEEVEFALRFALSSGHEHLKPAIDALA